MSHQYSTSKYRKIEELDGRSKLFFNLEAKLLCDIVQWHRDTINQENQWQQKVLPEMYRKMSCNMITMSKSWRNI